MVAQPPVCKHQWCKSNQNVPTASNNNLKCNRGANVDSEIDKISARENQNNTYQRGTVRKDQAWSQNNINRDNSAIESQDKSYRRETSQKTYKKQGQHINEIQNNKTKYENSEQRKTVEEVKQILRTNELQNETKTFSTNSRFHSDSRETFSKTANRVSDKILNGTEGINNTLPLKSNNQKAKGNSSQRNTVNNSQHDRAKTPNENSSFVHVGANFTAYMTKNMVNVSINGIKSNALCDTGATVSCISKQFFEKAFSAQKPNINPCQIKSIIGVGGTHHPVLGAVQVDVKFGTLALAYSFYVIEDLHHSVILGHDFMEAHHVKLDIRGKKMTIQDNIKVCSLRTNTGYARTIKPATLPANSEIDIQVKIARVTTNDEVLLEPLSKLTNINIMGAKCLVKVNKGRSVMRLVNPTDKDIHLRGNRVLAVVSQVDQAKIFTLNECKSDTPQSTEPNKSKMTQPKFTFNLDNADLNEKEKEKLLSLLNKNSDIFSEGLHDLGKTHLATHHIDTGDAQPVKLPPYKQTPEMRRVTQKHVEDLKRNDMIRESNSNWHSPVVLVKKANSDEYRFAVDYRKLNKVSKSQAYPIPRLSDIFDAIGEANAHYFSSLDLGKAFWQVPLSEESKERAAFITYDGIFEFQTMPFGLQGAPATFQHLMMKVLRGISWKYVLCYVDDVIIFSATLDEHLHHLEEVFSRLRNAGLKLSPDKCFFAQKKLHYLGHVISKAGIETDPKKIEKIVNLQAPKDQKGVKSLLGLTNYYKKFIAGYSKICSPLFNLLKKGNPFIWSKECEEALTTLKHAMTTSPVLAFPNMNREFTLTCDASRSGLGFILGQVDENNKERVIEFGGRALHKSEKNYSVSELECLAIVEGVKTYKSYLSTGIPFTIITDHKALTCLNSLTNSQNGRLARWALFLQGFRYKVVYRKGEENNADALSRLTKEASEIKDSEQIETQVNMYSIEKQSNKESNPQPSQSKADNGPLSKENHNWLELTLDFEQKENINSLDTKQNDINETTDKSNTLEIISQQQECSDFKHIYKYFTQNELPEDEKLKRTVFFEKQDYDILDGILMHKYRPRSRKKPVDETFIFQTALPKKQRLKVMQEFHDNNGHFGFKKTYAAIQTKYYWPKMFQDISDFVKSCDRCQRAKRDAHPSTTPLNPLPVAKVFERLHIDLIGPLPKTTAGHEHILVCVDSFSRWVEAFPLHDQTAPSIARVLHDEIFCRYGAPISIVSDRGRNFLSKLCNAVCEIYRVARHKTASYNPRANGCVERQNATIAQTIRMYVNKDQTNWHLLLPTVLMSIRSSPNTETSGYSPFKMLFGDEMRLPFDTTLIPRETLGPEAKTHVTQLIDRLKIVHEQAARNTELTQTESKQKHDANAKDSNFLLGEQVLLKVHKTRTGLAKKFEDKFTGPFYIREKGPYDTYKIADCENHKLIKNFINAQDLKRYYDPQNYRYEPPEDILFEDESDADTIIYDPNENETNEPEANREPVVNEETEHNENTNQNENGKTGAKRKWYSANKVLKQRKTGKNREYLVEWSDVRFKPTWEHHEDVGEDLQRQFYVRHTKTGRRRKRPYKYFND